MEREPEQTESRIPETLGPEISATDLARLAGISPVYVGRLCKYAELEARKLGNYWLIRREVAEAWLLDRDRRLAERERRRALNKRIREQLELPGIGPEPEPEPET